MRDTDLLKALLFIQSDKEKFYNDRMGSMRAFDDQVKPNKFTQSDFFVIQRIDPAPKKKKNQFDDIATSFHEFDKDSEGKADPYSLYTTEIPFG